ncbi:MAG: general stress protein [Gemmatimonadetes bacterium]|nr:general stress protein [Gemmatimonadota bacterium]
MKTRQLGKDGPDISVIGLGAWPIGGGMGVLDEAVSIATVRASIDSGITLLDTAQAYRTSESTLGKALSDGYRERCFLATKVSRDYSPDAVRSAMDDSLKALNVDYVDLYQVHSWNTEYPIDATMETMARLQEEGKTRYIGISNFNAEEMEQAYGTAPFHGSQPRYNMVDRKIETEDLPYCEQRGIGNLVHSPLGKGLLTGKYSAGHVFPEDDERSRFPRFQGELFTKYCELTGWLSEVAADIGLTMVQLAIAWCLRQKAVSTVLVGAKTPEQAVDYLPAAEAELDAETLKRIDVILEDTPAES